MKPVKKKFETVVSRNTFYFFNEEFEEKHEAYLNSISQTLLILKNHIENDGLKKEHFDRLLTDKKNGLRALLALTGFSSECLKRIITLIRVVDEPELTKLTLKQKWNSQEPPENIKEWSDTKIAKMIKENADFRKGIINLFFEGSSVSFLTQTIPLFELKKLSISKLKFEVGALVDTLARYKEKGSYSGKRDNNPEALIGNVLDELNITFESGDLTELVKNSRVTKRTMDFIIPNKSSPKIIIESSFLVTTSSGQGDKSKTEVAVGKLIKKHYPKAKFWGFVDGIGWYVRRGDLKRMVSAYHDVFTFRKDELNRFKQSVFEIMGRK